MTSDRNKTKTGGNDLKDFFAELIADHDHIDTETVSLQYIMERREEDIYPKKRYDIGSRYGGYDNLGLYVFTKEELKKISTISEKILHNI
ncbi:MAG: hypothetical protein GY864_01890 [Desulfobacterales bacterium]|nr:hypothetical protein [Desulfobacterales bacterium]